MTKITFILHVHNMTNRKKKNNKEKKQGTKRKESYFLDNFLVGHGLLLLDFLTFQKTEIPVFGG